MLQTVLCGRVNSNTVTEHFGMGPDLNGMQCILCDRFECFKLPALQFVATGL